MIIKELGKILSSIGLCDSVEDLPANDKRWLDRQVNGQIGSDITEDRMISRKEEKWFKSNSTTQDQREAWVNLIGGVDAKIIKRTAKEMGVNMDKHFSLIDSRRALFELFQDEALSSDLATAQKFGDRLDKRSKEQDAFFKSFIER